MNFITAYRLISFFIFLGLFPFSLISQITVDNSAPYNTATYLVQNVLLGQGVTASNITSIAMPQQRGFFNGMSSNIGMDSGFVMSSGDIRDLVPFQTGTNPNSQTTVPANYVTDLTRVANSAFKMLGLGYSISGIYDMCVIEFDFIPIGDSLEFHYVFSSDEYLTYVNTQYNDVFAFFLYGPGITPTDNMNNISQALGADGTPDFSSRNINGTNYFPQNIAVVPNTNPGQPITISSVNPGINSQYYINNPANTTVASNGFTTLMKANATVQCGQKYHIRLMVADASDGILNTDVFLEGGSFTSAPSIEISAIPPNILGGVSGGADTALFEQCGPVVLTLVRQGNNTVATTFLISTGGSAMEGIDFSAFPDSITFPAGQDTISISFMPLEDFSPDGLEDLVVQFTGFFCSTISTNSIALTISDSPPLTIFAQDDTINCLVSSTQIGIQASGLPQLSYLWSTGVADTNAITVSPAVTTDYFVTVTDGCGVNTQVQKVTVYVMNEPVVISSQDDSVNCVSPDVQIGVQVSSGLSPFTYQWSNGATTDSTTVTPFATTDYYITVTDICGMAADTDTVTVTVITSDVLLTTNDTSTVCPGDTVNIVAHASGGFPPYTIWWTANGTVISSDSVLIANPTDTTTYTAYITDFCQSSTALATATVNVQQYPQLTLNAGANDTLHCPGDAITIVPTANGGSSGYTYSWTNWNDTNQILDTSIFASTNFVVAVFDNCPTDTIYDTVMVFIPPYTPVLAIPENVIHSCPYEPVTLNLMNVSGGEGTYSYQWSNSAGTADTAVVSPEISGIYTVTVTDACGNTGTATLNVSIVVPQADFTFDLKEDNTVIFTNQSILADTFHWDFGDGGTSTLQNPVYNYQLVNEYDVILYVESEYGCSDTAIRTLTPPMQIWIPNAFTPNDDGINDIFQISGIGIGKFFIQIFDRWGELIFQSDNITNSWDGKSHKGKLMPGDAFVYKIKAEGLKGEKFKKMGHVILVR